MTFAVALSIKGEIETVSLTQIRLTMYLSHVVWLRSTFAKPSAPLENSFVSKYGHCITADAPLN